MVDGGAGMTFFCKGIFYECVACGMTFDSLVRVREVWMK